MRNFFPGHGVYAGMSLHQSIDLHRNEITLEPADLALTLLAAIIFGLIFAAIRRMANR